MAFLGIDIGGTSTKLALIEGNTVQWTARSPAYQRPTTSQLVDAIRTAAAGRAAPLSAVGLCVPGLLDAERKRVTLSVNVPGLVGVELREILRPALGELPPMLHVTSDAVAAGYDLWATRSLTGRLLVLCIGTGIGAAVIDDDVPLAVDGDSPGHIGQIDVSLDNTPPIGPDGGAGSLEGYLGVVALTRQYGPDLSQAVQTWSAAEPPVRALARAVRICHAIYRPQHVCLAGGMGIRLGHLLPELKSMIDKDLTRTARPDWSLSAGDSDYHSARGAARFVARQAQPFQRHQPGRSS